MDKDINHDFIVYFINLVHEEGNQFLPIRSSNMPNVMSPNKNFLNLTFDGSSGGGGGNNTADISTHSAFLTAATTTPTTSGEPKRIYPRSIKHQQQQQHQQQQSYSPRALVHNASFDSYSSVCSTPRHANVNGNTSIMPNPHSSNRLTRNYSSISCQSSPGFDHSPRYQNITKHFNSYFRSS